MGEFFAEAIVSYGMFFIGLFVLFLIFGIFAFLSKFAIFRFAGRTILYAIQIVFNLMATGLLILAITGVIIGLILLGSYQFDLFLVDGNMMMFGDEIFLPTAFILAICSVLGGVIGSLFLSMLPLSSISFIALVYGAGAFSLIGISPILLRSYVPGVHISFLELLILSVALPIVILVYAIATGQKRKENLRSMDYRKRKRYLNEEERRHHRSKNLIFPWITYRNRGWKET